MAAVRLGRNLADGGLLHENSVQNGLAVLGRFREVLTHYQPQSLRVCGTEALRQAKNSRLFLPRAEEILQHPIEIISGEDEARLSFAGALAGSTEPWAGPLLLADVGGGSTELVFAAAPAGKIRVASMGLGAVGLAEQFLAAPQPDPAHLDTRIATSLNSAFKDLALNANKQPLLIIGCGGTATSMAALDLNLAAYDASLVHGRVLHSAAMEKLWHRLIALPPDKRNGLPCLGDGRGEILPAGLRIYTTLLQLLQQDRMRVSDTGLLEGILLSSLPHAAA